MLGKGRQSGTQSREIAMAEEKIDFQELGDLGGLNGEVSGEMRVPLLESEMEEEGSTLDEPVFATLVSHK